ncbi:MAG TPA: formate dehydrogenase accessory sulfurtransferase FdhD, partial [Opitutaceae bacterium]
MSSPTASPASLAASVRSVSVEKYAGGAVVPLADRVPVEEPLEIKLAFDRGALRTVRSVAVTMRTPGHDLELATGFLTTEGILHSRDEIADMSQPAANVVRIDLAAGAAPDLRGLERNFYTTSSCGVCGKASLAAVRTVAKSPLPAGRPRLSAALVPELPERLRAAQPLFEHTGGLHAAGLFDASGRLLVAREDVGRHNAVDKLVGARLLAGTLP